MWARFGPVGTEPTGGLVYVRVEFWPDQATRNTGVAPTLVNDFRFSTPESYQAPVVDSSGRWQCRSGAYVIPMVEVNGEWVPRPDDPADPYTWQTVQVDVAGELLNVVSGFVTAHVATTGDLTDPAVQVGDAQGLAARADLQALAGIEREV